MYRYYSTEYPIRPNVFPLFANTVVSFNEKADIPGVGSAWGYLEYEQQLSAGVAETCGPLSARTARENLLANGLPGEILTGDLRQAPLPVGGFDLVVSNPPYFPVGSGKSAGPARSEEFCSLEQLCAAAGRLVKNGGRFSLCHRPERLTDVLCALRAHDLEPKRLKLVSHGPDRPPSLLLVEAVKQGKLGLTIEISHNP